MVGVCTIYLSTYLPTYPFIYLSVDTCTDLCVYMHVCIYIYLYIYMYMCVWLLPGFRASGLKLVGASINRCMVQKGAKSLVLAGRVLVFNAYRLDLI